MLKLGYKYHTKQSMWLVSQRVTIGSHADCDFVIKDPSILPEHVDLIVKDNRVTLVELTQRGTTWVNDVPVVSSCQLKVGDTIKLGHIELILSDPKYIQPPIELPKKAVSGWFLKVVDRSLPEKTYPVNDTLLVGRAIDCDIKINSPYLSRRHAELCLLEDVLYIKDLSSINGTFVNDEPVAEQRLRSGDRIRLDQLEFMIIGPPDNQHNTLRRSTLKVEYTRTTQKTGTGEATSRESSNPEYSIQQPQSAHVAKAGQFFTKPEVKNNKLPIWSILTVIVSGGGLGYWLFNLAKPFVMKFLHY
ncbi:FHA domain-containing protein [Zooshikella ganghwensis]|uniref:FHA domain-containing protein n=1 Tax=Zooshikella ganghwensis TaxID=202772 RepID=A0A4P9VPC6_9GAMM|nr:FHA domain-containing protein [Zooshikella ganghwensis]RDH45348.1 FHA domain-containing protein [Zooshikella ganghwensis]